MKKGDKRSLTSVERSYKRDVSDRRKLARHNQRQAQEKFKEKGTEESPLDAYLTN